MKFSTSSMKLSISEVMAGPGLCGMAGTLMAGFPTPDIKFGECGRLDAGGSRLGRSGGLFSMPSMKLSISEVMAGPGLCGMAGRLMVGFPTPEIKIGE